MVKLFDLLVEWPDHIFKLYQQTSALTTSELLIGKVISHLYNMITLLPDPSGPLHFNLQLKGKVYISNLGRRCSDAENLRPSNQISTGLQCQC